MKSKTNYALIDFGGGKKLESFDSVIVKRPAPPAKTTSIEPNSEWNAPDLEFVSRDIHVDRRWRKSRQLPAPWRFAWNKIRLQLQPTPFGHLGVFPEQQRNWEWMSANSASIRGKRVLNLFAYTGGSTLVAASLGAAVTHIDSAANIVERARENAAISGLESKPIRWIAEDALKFAKRELKRGNQYDGFILDPPSYGHGTKRESWKIERDLPELLSVLNDIASKDFSFLLVTCHSPGFEASALRGLADRYLVNSGDLTLSSGTLELESRSGKRLSSGHFLRGISPQSDEGS